MSMNTVVRVKGAAQKWGRRASKSFKEKKPRPPKPPKPAADEDVNWTLG